MPKVMECPFFVWEEGVKLHCEAGIIDFEEKESRTDYTECYCANLARYGECTLAQMLLKKYEREEQ